MSNIFDQELQDAIKGVYTLLEANKLSQEMLTQGAKLELYFAHGETERASNKLITDQQKSSERGKELKDATDASEVCDNIVTAATAASTNARNTNSSASTAAVNIQAAANSLTNLAADTAAVLAVATSKDYDSKIQKLADRAYTLTQAASEAAENTTLQSLETTIVAAQSRASVALTQSKVLAADTKTLLNTLNTSFAALQTKIDNDSAALTSAIDAENAQDAIYQIAKQEKEAMQFSEKFINQEANYNLKYIRQGTDGNAFSISFNSVGIEMPEKSPAIKEYRIIFTLEDDADTFDLHAAKNTEEGNYFVVSPATNRPHYSVDFITAENPACNLSGNTSPIARDYTGEAMLRGDPYVVFVYVVYNCDYQNEMGDTDGFLFLASLPFTLKTLLPAASQPKLNFYQRTRMAGTKCSVSNAVRVKFKVSDLMSNGVDLSEITDFRVILFNQEGEFASKLNHYTDEQLAKLAELDEKYRLTEQAYLNTRQADKTAIATGQRDFDNLKIKLATPQENYKKAAKAYQAQKEVIENLNTANLSKFFIDTDILKQIPEAFTMTAKIVDKNYVSVLQEELKSYEAQQTALTTEQTNLTAMQTDLNDNLNTLNQSNVKLDANIKELQIQLKEKQTAVEQFEVKSAQLIKEYLQIDDLEKICDLIKSLPEKTEIIKKLMDLFKSINGFRQDILKKAEELSLNEKKIAKSQRGLVSIELQLEDIAGKLESVDHNIKILKEEIVDLIPGILQPMGETRKELKATLAKMKESKAPAKEREKLEKEIADLEKEIATLEKVMKQLKEDENTESSSSSSSSSSLTRQFIAVNENGDFSDNYGEPMIRKQTYTALVFSVIKSSDPEAIPIFQPIASPFSEGQIYMLPQL